MRRKINCAALCSAALFSAMLIGSTSMARELPKWIAVREDEKEAAWEKLAMTYDGVETGVNVRKKAKVKSKVVGHIYPGCAVWVIEKGEKWTKISSGEIEGFVDNDYLLYGADAQSVAEQYGCMGVTAVWDGVSVYAEPSGDSEVWGELNAGDDLVLLEDNGHWLTVEYGEGTQAYVSEEDVQRAFLLDAAYGLDEEYTGNEKKTEESYEEEYYEEEYYEEEYYEENNEEYYEEENYGDEEYTDPGVNNTPDTEYTPPQTEPPQTDPPQTEPPQTDPPQTDPPQTEPPQTDPPQTDPPQTNSGGDVNVGDDGWYDADTDTYYDGNGNVISKSGQADWEEEGEYYEGETLPEETYAPETAGVNEDDAALLAALIYCEAGNQSYDGMTAVGSVVVNRVMDENFPDTVSDVIYQSGQFSPVDNGALESALANGVPSECYDAAVAALSGECPAGDVLYFNTGTGEGEIIDNQQFY